MVYPEALANEVSDLLGHVASLFLLLPLIGNVLGRTDKLFPMECISGVNKVNDTFIYAQVQESRKVRSDQTTLSDTVGLNNTLPGS